MITAKASAVSAAAPSTLPAMSTRCPSGSAFSGSTARAPTSASAPTARLNQKIARQSPCLPIRAPPITGPIASATPDTVVQTPSAQARSRSSV